MSTHATDERVVKVSEPTKENKCSQKQTETQSKNRPVHVANQTHIWDPKKHPKRLPKCSRNTDFPSWNVCRGASPKCSTQKQLPANPAGFGRVVFRAPGSSRCTAFIYIYIYRYIYIYTHAKPRFWGVGKRGFWIGFEGGFGEVFGEVLERLLDRFLKRF